MKQFLIKTYLWIILLPIVFQGLGAGLNQAVLIANGDRFPVEINAVQSKGASPDSMLDDVHCVMSRSTHLNALADIFDFHTATYSVGDGLINLGEWLWSFAPFVWAFAVLKKVYVLA